MIAISMTPRMLDTLEVIRKHEPITAHEVAQHLGVGMASARTYLQNLRAMGFARPNAGTRWAYWVTCRVESNMTEIIQCASVWEYAARCRMQQENRA
jgi:DNA-binding IclR family transcriptional regulator